MRGLPFDQGATIRTYLSPQPSRMSHFPATVFKFTSIKLSKSPLLRDTDLLVARELELGPVRASVTCSLFCSLGWTL